MQDKKLLYNKKIGPTDMWGQRFLAVALLTMSSALSECLAASPVSTHCLSATTSSGCENQRYLQTLPNVPWGIKSIPVENH